jgi:hypothetical protein
VTFGLFLLCSRLSITLARGTPSAAAPTAIRGLPPTDFSPVVSATDIWRVLGALGGVTAVAMPAMTMSEHVMGEGWSEESTPNW